MPYASGVKTRALQICNAHGYAFQVTDKEFIELMTANNWAVARFSSELISAFKVEVHRLPSGDAPGRYPVQGSLEPLL